MFLGTPHGLCAFHYNLPLGLVFYYKCAPPEPDRPCDSDVATDA